MFKKVLNNQKGSLEVIVMFTIVMIICTMLFVFRNMIVQFNDETQALITTNTEIMESTKEEVETPIVKEEIVEKPKVEDIKKEEVKTDNIQVVNNTPKKSLWDEIKVEVIAGIIVSVLSFLAGQMFILIKHKKSYKF